jgi:hypothetical protein
MPVTVMLKAEKKTALSKYGCLSTEATAFSARTKIKNHAHLKSMIGEGLPYSEKDIGKEDLEKG